MLSVAQAQARILDHARPLPAELQPLDVSLCGLVLAEDVASDLDMPPHDKALMDGYAVRSADLPSGRGVLTVVEEITAGQTPRTALAAGQAARIMTGAPLPPGADAVVMVERSRMEDENRAHLEDPAIAPGQNVLARGREMLRGETILSRGTVLRAQELGVLATIGRTAVKVHPRPTVAILSTGDELVDPAEKPGPGQIRNSHGAMLSAQVFRAGGKPGFLGIARDRLEHLRPLVAEGLRSRVFVLSGGVSAGKRDLVPAVLEELGVQTYFHKVEMKPGKPVLFGTRDGCLVFGLPGNPVSAFACFELFVRPAFSKLLGCAEAKPRQLEAELIEDFTYKTDRPTYHPAHLEAGKSGWTVQPVPWFGSADLRGLLKANALVLVPAGDHRHRAGQQLAVLPLDGVT
jgi:molybdopterin molybdotransferase